MIISANADDAKSKMAASGSETRSLIIIAATLYDAALAAISGMVCVMPS